MYWKKYRPMSFFIRPLTGIGATYSEIKAQRHSIIIEPNVPVIIGKCNSDKHKNDNLLGVYEGVTTDRIIKYLGASRGKYYKILTTPESFTKVKDAFLIFNGKIYNTCFLLIDEAHKTIKDVDYRSDIVLPMNDFFKFKGRRWYLQLRLNSVTHVLKRTVSVSLRLNLHTITLRRLI